MAGFEVITEEYTCRAGVRTAQNLSHVPVSYGAADGLSHQLTDLYCWIASDPFV
jgi:hypothetical protein